MPKKLRLWWRLSTNDNQLLYSEEEILKAIDKIKNDKGSHKCERIIKALGLKR
jgi:hypothetical protein